MAEILLNWAVVLATLAALFFIAWLGFRDLYGMGQPQASSRRPQVLGYDAPPPRPQAAEDEEPLEAQHRLLVEYHRNGHAEHTQWVTDERPGYIGTENLPGMGGGILVRHVRVFHDGDGFSLENRHGTRPLEWRANGGRSGELPPGQSMPVEGEVDVILGDWTVTCREEG